MIILLTYDISDDRLRRSLHKQLKEYGLPTQKSVFECDVDGLGLRRIRHLCASTIDLETDSVRIYPVCASCSQRTKMSGLGIKVVRMDYMVV